MKQVFAIIAFGISASAATAAIPANPVPERNIVIAALSQPLPLAGFASLETDVPALKFADLPALATKTAEQPEK